MIGDVPERGALERGALVASGLAVRLLRQWESPPTWLLAFGLFVWLQARFLPVLPTGSAMRGLGAAFILIGAAVLLAALPAFRAAATTILPRERPSALLTRGVYALSRNPIYLGDALMLAGWALRHDLASLLLVPVFMRVIMLRFIRGEEAGLTAAFGREYEAYAARVRRWL